jgi:hypothetical protein
LFSGPARRPTRKRLFPYMCIAVVGADSARYTSQRDALQNSCLAPQAGPCAVEARGRRLLLPSHDVTST